MARTMSPVERAARDVLNRYVRDGLVSRAEANAVIRNGLHIAETAVRTEYAKGWGSALYYGQKVAAAREEFDATRPGSTARMTKGARLLSAEMYAAVFAAVEAEKGVREGNESLTPQQAEQVMATVRDTAEEMRDDTSASPTAAA